MKILVVEDEKDMNHIIKKELESEGYLVDTCYDGESAYDYLVMEEYDGVVLDVMLPGMNGFEVLKKARSRGVQTPVLFLSARSHIDDIVEGLDIGADDYMIKPFAFQELSARVRAMTRKKAGVRENIYRCGDLVVDCNEHMVRRGDTVINLSPKEFSVLLYLIRNQNIVVSREQIEANIWDMEHDSYSNVIDVYIRYLRKKIDDPCEVKLIRTIRGGGVCIKGRRVKQVTIGRHILQLLISALAVMAVAMLIFVHILANVAVDYDIRQSLERVAYKNLKEIQVDQAGKISYKEDFVLTEGDIHFLVLDADGQLVFGAYPKGCPQDIPVSVKKMHQVTNDGEEFYIRDMRKHYYNGDYYVCMRAIVRKSDAYSRYQMLEYLAYVSILVVSCIAIICGLLLSRHISNSLKGMCRSAEMIGQNRNMSSRMEYNGKFYELAVLTQANNRMLDRLQETFQQQEQFTSDVAHELRTPVAVMTAQCQYAHGKTVSQEEYREAFEVIERQSFKIGEIISRLLELSRLDYDRREIAKEDVDLPELVESVCEDLQQKYEDSLQLQLRLAQAHTVGDISLVMIAIQNLITNAIRYSGEASPIEVETGMREEMAFVSVKDYGAGICEEDLPHIFKRFYKADKSRNSKGFGLGLPLTMKIAQKHGGTVLAESRQGEGSMFTLLLPKTGADADTGIERNR